MWQRGRAAQADAVIVPSEFARERLREMGAPLPWERVHVLAPPLRPPPDAVQAPPAPPGGRPLPAPGSYALLVARLSPEKGVDVAIDACRMAGTALVVAGEGPQHAELRERVRGAEVT